MWFCVLSGCGLLFSVGVIVLCAAGSGRTASDALGVDGHQECLQGGGEWVWPCGGCWVWSRV